MVLSNMQLQQQDKFATDDTLKKNTYLFSGVSEATFEEIFP